MQMRGVVFDLDGTLVYYSIDRDALKRDLLSLIRNFGLPTSSLSDSDGVWAIVKKAMYLANSIQLPKNRITSLIDSMYEVIERYEVDAAERLSLIDGVVQVLDYVKVHGFKVALYTLCGKRPAMKVLDRFNLARYFDAIVTRDDVKHLKPHPEHLMKAIQLIGLSPSEVIVVGDSVLDAECAKKVGAIFVGVKTGVRSAEELMLAGADYILNSVAELPKLLYLLSPI
ncbi:MAG: HAD family hydrolase [archaeon GB-1867-005]|nr:HAD family hydrolase [Candidatus Culexmicrobium cathedralense]